MAGNVEADPRGVSPIYQITFLVALVLLFIVHGIGCWRTWEPGRDVAFAAGQVVGFLAIHGWSVAAFFVLFVYFVVHTYVHTVRRRSLLENFF